MKILLVEDEMDLGASITDYLSREQYVCEWVTSYAAAAEKLEDHDYICLVLDINLPDGNGLSLLSLLKRLKKNRGVIIVSARNGLNDRIEGLQLGADDYLIKPFYLPELAARIAAIIRRRVFDGGHTIEYCEIAVDLEGRVVSVNGKPVTLTKKEYELLVFFLSNKDKNLSKSAISEHLWGDYMDNTENFDFLYTHIKNLKRKLTNNNATNYIHSLYGQGYRFGKLQHDDAQQEV